MKGVQRGKYAQEEGYLTLISAGSRRLDVIVRTKELLGLSLSETRALVDQGNLVLSVGHPCSAALVRLRDEFRALGADVRFSPLDGLTS